MATHILADLSTWERPCERLSYLDATIAWPIKANAIAIQVEETDPDGWRAVDDDDQSQLENFLVGFLHDPYDFPVVAWDGRHYAIFLHVASLE